MSVVVTDPFFKKLYSKIFEEVGRRKESIAAGGSIKFRPDGTNDAVSTALQYRADVAFLEALNLILEVGLQLDRDHYGVRSQNDIDGDI